MATVTVTTSTAGGMGALDFIATVVQAVAWPLALVVVALLFRAEIVGLLRRLRKASGFGVNIETDYDEAAKETKAAVETIRSSAEPAARYLVELPELLPHRVGLIVRTWNDIEQWLRAKVRVETLNIGATPMEVVDAGQRQGVLSPADAKALRGLYAMRSLAVHGPVEETNERRMNEFLALAGAIKTLLDIPPGA